MQKLAPATEQFQHFNLRESFWGDLNGRTREAWKKFFEADSERQRFIVSTWNGKPAPSRFLHKQLDVTQGENFG